MRFDKSVNVKVDGCMRLHMIEAQEVLPATWLTRIPNQANQILSRRKCVYIIYIEILSNKKSVFKSLHCL